MDALKHSQLLIESLLESNLLVDQLGLFKSFDRSLLGTPSIQEALNFEQKLGHLYEDALRHMLERSEVCELLGSNLQVFRPTGSNARQTLGELDYLVRTEQETIHLELAVKFYLAVKQDDGAYKWPGPDARDNWERKRQRMESHQFKVAELDETRGMLGDDFRVSEVETQHLIYGCLFDPIFAAPSPADSVSPECHRGYWLRRDDWDKVVVEKQIWKVPKHLWPVVPSVKLTENLERTNKREMMDLSEERCSMFTDGKVRYFLVSDRWLEMTGA